jgi:2-phosphosulfolactate phosphatase
MNIILASLIPGAREARGTAVIIDVFRAFTTAAVAFSRGARQIVLVGQPSEALDLKARGVGDLCMGEMYGMAPDGFDFGNSPYELFQADVEGKTLVHSTMAGTIGVTAAEGADEIYLGSLVLAAPTAKRILARGAKEVSIVAMGGGGEFRTDEDEQCALYIRNLLQGRQPDPEAVRSLVLSGGESQKFGDPAQPVFHARDLEMALQIDSVDFAIRVHREDGLLIARPEPA